MMRAPGERRDRTRNDDGRRDAAAKFCSADGAQWTYVARDRASAKYCFEPARVPSRTDRLAGRLLYIGLMRTESEIRIAFEQFDFRRKSIVHQRERRVAYIASDLDLVFLEQHHE